MENNITQLFVYGSLRSGFRRPAFDYISKHFAFVCNAKVKGQLYDVGNYPAAMPAEDGFIVGELYRLKEEGEFEWAIKQLDDYEGLNPEEGEDPLYNREQTNVFCDDKTVKAWIYWYNGNVSGLPLIPSGDVFDYPNYKSKL